MKQKKIGTTLYVFSEDPYVITEDTDANIIYIQEEVIFDFAKINIPLISKMKPINYHPVCVTHPEWADYYNDFTVYVEQTTGGTVTAYPTSGDEGEEIQVSHVSSEKYVFDHWNIVDEDGNEIEVNNGKFLMPASDVTVSAVFIQTVFSITINDAEHGTVTSNKQTASIGETVTLTINPDSGYKLNTLTVVDESSNPITVTNNQFIMPTGDVTITGTFVKAGPVPYEEQYFTIESQAVNNVISWICNNNSGSKSIYVSTDGTNWTSKTSNTTGVTLATLGNGDKLYVRGNLDGYSTTSYYSYITSTNNFKVYGNIMSLTDGDNFVGVTSLTKDYQLYRLFNQSKVTDASNLILPATTLSNWCYSCMFRGCTSLTTAPQLPATTLSDLCYNNMFYGCTSLTTAPELPANTLANYCYQNMFQYCTSINSITMLATNISATNCLKNWVNGVAAKGTFTKAASMESLPTGDSGIPSGWTVVNA